MTLHVALEIPAHLQWAALILYLIYPPIFQAWRRFFEGRR